MVRKQRIATRISVATRSPAPPPNGADELFTATAYERSAPVKRVIATAIHKTHNANQLNLLATRRPSTGFLKSRSMPTSVARNTRATNTLASARTRSGLPEAAAHTSRAPITAATNTLGRIIRRTILGTLLSHNLTNLWSSLIKSSPRKICTIMDDLLAKISNTRPSHDSESRIYSTESTISVSIIVFNP